MQMNLLVAAMFGSLLLVQRTTENAGLEWLGSVAVWITIGFYVFRYSYRTPKP
jgi:hypothetical protein